MIGRNLYPILASSSKRSTLSSLLAGVVFIITPAVLSNVLIRIAVPSMHIGWKFWEQGDDSEAVSPLAKHNNVFILVGHIRQSSMMEVVFM